MIALILHITWLLNGITHCTCPLLVNEVVFFYGIIDDVIETIGITIFTFWTVTADHMSAAQFPPWFPTISIYLPEMITPLLLKSYPNTNQVNDRLVHETPGNRSWILQVHLPKVPGLALGKTSSPVGRRIGLFPCGVK